MQLSTKAVKTNTRKKLNFHELKECEQSKRGKSWTRTDKRSQWETLQDA